jgi:hypothetical protein
MPLAALVEVTQVAAITAVALTARPPPRQKAAPVVVIQAAVTQAVAIPVVVTLAAATRAGVITGAAILAVMATAMVPPLA